jgi:uncharacterized protein (DUF1330 family)
MTKINPKIVAGLFLAFAAAACAPKHVAEKKPAPDYQMKVALSAPPNVSKICYDQQSLTTYNARMLQQELAVGTLSCQNADGTRKYEKQYGDVLAKFGGDLSSNAAELKSLTASRRLNMDVLVTEFANREAQRRNQDPEYCSRLERAFAWALSPSVTSLTQVPPPHDLGPEMNAFPCPK